MALLLDSPTKTARARVLPTRPVHSHDFAHRISHRQTLVSPSKVAQHIRTASQHSASGQYRKALRRLHKALNLVTDRSERMQISANIALQQRLHGEQLVAIAELHVLGKRWGDASMAYVRAAKYFSKAKTLFLKLNHEQHALLSDSLHWDALSKQSTVVRISGVLAIEKDESANF